MPSGRPDWFGTIVAAGKYNSTFLPMAVDVNGNMIGLMKGDDSGTLRTLAVDGSGIMKANLSVQDLDFLTVRPAYGEAKRVRGDVAVAIGDTEVLLTVNGRGVILGGEVQWEQTVESAVSVNCQIFTEETQMAKDDIESLWRYAKRSGVDGPIFLGRYEPTIMRYAICFSPGTTFETKLEIKQQNSSHAATITFYTTLYYALVPS